MTESMNSTLARQGFNITARTLAVGILSDGWKMTVLGKHLSFTAPQTPTKVYIGKKGSFRHGPNLAQSVPFLDATKREVLKKGKVFMANQGLK